jgi:FAD/FMN-containing dehydrogenase
MTAPSPAQLRGLAEGLGDALVDRSDLAYEEARRIWNAAIDRRPAAIAYPGSEAEVEHCVGWAVENEVEIAVRGGGHNVAGLAVCDDGLVIDLSRLAAVSIDAGARLATVGGGATWAALDAASGAHRLASTGGVISSTGVAGLTLGGGLGWLARRAGAACDNLVGARVVTAAGSTVDVSLDEHPDLLWALRGGGGNFGVVTELRFRLHPIGETVLAGALAYPAERAESVLATLASLASEAPETLALAVSLQSAPPLPTLPPELVGAKVVALGACWSGDPARDGEIEALLRRAGEPLLSTLGRLRYADWQKANDRNGQPGLFNYWKAGYLPSLEPSIAAALADYGRTAPSTMTHLDIHVLGGAHSREPEGGSAYGHRDAGFVYNLIATWPPGDPSGEASIEHTRDAHAAISAVAGDEAYVNYLAEDETARIERAFDPGTHRRLQGVKATYDPANVFHRNHNILPAAR